MARIEFPDPKKMTEAQRRVYDDVVRAPRTRAPQPFTAWLHAPELARRAFDLGEFVRFGTTLPPALVQLAALVVAKHWSAPYLWKTRKQDALKAGLDGTVIDDIARGAPPRFARAEERAVYEFSVALQSDRAVGSGVYKAAVAAVGEPGVVELVAALGYYTLVAMTLVSFEIGLPEGAGTEGAP